MCADLCGSTKRTAHKHSPPRVCVVRRVAGSVETTFKNLFRDQRARTRTRALARQVVGAHREARTDRAQLGSVFRMGQQNLRSCARDWRLGGGGRVASEQGLFG